MSQPVEPVPVEEMEPQPDERVLACNYAEATSACAQGALCYPLLYPDCCKGSCPRILILARSRGGRWIRKRERLDRLTNFRFKTIPPEHPRYRDLWGSHWDEGAAERFGQLAGEAAAKK